MLSGVEIVLRFVSVDICCSQFDHWYSGYQLVTSNWRRFRLMLKGTKDFSSRSFVSSVLASLCHDLAGWSKDVRRGGKWRRWIYRMKSIQCPCFAVPSSSAVLFFKVAVSKQHFGDLMPPNGLECYFTCQNDNSVTESVRKTDVFVVFIMHMLCTELWRQCHDFDDQESDESQFSRSSK